jgi:hypothetical protein
MAVTINSANAAADLSPFFGNHLPSARPIRKSSIRQRSLAPTDREAGTVRRTAACGGAELEIESCGETGDPRREMNLIEGNGAGLSRRGVRKLDGLIRIAGAAAQRCSAKLGIEIVEVGAGLLNAHAAEAFGSYSRIGDSDALEF